MTDIVERLLTAYLTGPDRDVLTEAADAIAQLRAEVEEWKERWAAERRDHEATIRHFDELMNEVPA
jgi:hypothetical protein